MAIWRAIAWFYILIMVAFVFDSSLFPHTSTTCFQCGRKLANLQEGIALTQKFKKGFQSNQGRRRGNIGGDLSYRAEESAREVPTGPDPLHHHDINPSGP